MSTFQKKNVNRDGAIIPLLAMLLPVLLILCGFAINLAYYQLTTTELKIATDVASHAGGRSLNVYQNMDQPTADKVVTKMQQTIDNYYQRNEVAGQTLTPPADFSSYIELYALGSDQKYIDQSAYDGGISESEARSGEIFNGVSVSAIANTESVFNVAGINRYFSPERNSVTRQNERDISIVIDKSGSMLLHNNDPLLKQAIIDLENDGVISERERDYALGRYRVMRLQDRRWQNNYWGSVDTEVYYSSYNLYRQRFDNLPQQSTNANRDYYAQGIQALKQFSSHQSPRKAKYGDKFYPINNFDNNGTQATLNTDNVSVVDALAGYSAPGVTSEQVSELVAYAQTWEENRYDIFKSDDQFSAGVLSARPDESRWDYLERGIQAYVDELETTPADEKLALIVFDSGAHAESILTSDYDAIMNKVKGIVPLNGTSIHDGMQVGLDEVLQLNTPVDQRTVRPFASKSIVIMTDGNNSDSSKLLEPVEVAKQFAIDHEEVLLHTLTFGYGAGTSLNPDFPDPTDPDVRKWDGVMVDVAIEGRGKHFHASDGEELIDNLKILALILPTIYTY
jgi:hypothetical protein